MAIDRYGGALWQWSLAGLLCVAAWASGAYGGDPSAGDPSATVGAALRSDPAPAHALVDEIDRELTTAWQADGVAPAPASKVIDSHEFAGAA